jgi:methionine-gamma-lyase
MNKKFPLHRYQFIGPARIRPRQNADYSHLTPIYASSTFTFDSAQQGSDRFAGADKTRDLQPLGQPYFYNRGRNHCRAGNIWRH